MHFCSAWKSSKFYTKILNIFSIYTKCKQCDHHIIIIKYNYFIICIGIPTSIIGKQSQAANRQTFVIKFGKYQKTISHRTSKVKATSASLPINYAFKFVKYYYL